MYIRMTYCQILFHELGRSAKKRIKTLLGVNKPQKKLNTKPEIFKRNERWGWMKSQKPAIGEKGQLFSIQEYDL